MIDMLKRHEIQVLRRAGHDQADVAALAGVSVRSVRRVDDEPPVAEVDDDAERARRRIGRPSKAEPFRTLLIAELAKEPELMALELLRRARLKGYAGAKTAIYDLVKELRPEKPRPIVRFEGLPGEFSQHDFGHVDVRYLDGTKRRVHFFASRLKYSRWVEVTLVPNERVESLVRTMVDHFAAWGGRPLLAVFDRPKTIAISWTKDGHVTQWNPIFAGVVLDLGLGVELCWPKSPRAEGLRRESGRLGQGLLLQTAALPRRRGPVPPARGVARGGQPTASVPGHRSHSRRAPGRGESPPSCPARCSRRSGAARSGGGRRDRLRRP